ncbi:MAG TPA: hypothetical protein VIY69_02135 [Candidatus Acidoferrales bacterium]
MLLVALLCKWYIGLPLIVVCFVWLETRTPPKQPTESTITARAYRLGERISRLLPKRKQIIAPSISQLPSKQNQAWSLKTVLLFMGSAAIVCGVGYLTRFEYFKNPAGATVRTNRWTEETDVLSDGGWRVVQTHEQWVTDQWMGNHPGEIPPEAKQWFSSHALCSVDGANPDCDVPANDMVDTTTNSAGKQWVLKYGHYDDGGWLVPVPPDTDVFDGERVLHTPRKTNTTPTPVAEEPIPLPKDAVISDPAAEEPPPSQPESGR